MLQGLLYLLFTLIIPGSLSTAPGSQYTAPRSLATASGLAADLLQQEFQQRIARFTNGTLEMEECDIFTELLRLEMKDERYCELGVWKEIEKINRHDDGTDFNLASVAWILHRYWDSPQLTQEVKDALVTAVTNLTLWYGDPGFLGPMQYWSENHQSGWNAAEYLIGAGFAARPELESVIFRPTGLTGRQHAERGRDKMVAWLNHRLKYGFSEYNSDTYAKFSFRGVVSVAALSPDHEVASLARLVLNLQIYDFLLASQNTRLITARGRAYAGGKLSNSGGLSVIKLITGHGGETEWNFGSGDGVYFTIAVLAGYTPPTVFLQIPRTVQNGTMVLEERFGLGEYEEGGDGGEDATDCTFWFGNGGYFSPVYPRCLFIVGDEYDLWDRQEIWSQVKPAKVLWDTDPFLVDLIGEIGAPLGHGPVLGPANMRTFRSPGLVLSSMQDYKGGYMAGQQHSWQATLDTYRYGNIFTIQPTNFQSTQYWEGGVLPRNGQFGSTLISLYNPEPLATVAFGVNMTHAHLRLGQFDEMYTHWMTDGSDGSWRIVRQGDSYLALYSWRKAEFVEETMEDGEVIIRDLVAPGEQNVWICEVGSKQMNGSFSNFLEQIITSEVDVSVVYDNSLVECLLDNDCFSGILELVNCMIGVCSNTAKNGRRSDMSVTYTRSNNSYEFGWFEELTVNGAPVNLGNFNRYENMFSSMAWGARNITLTDGDFFLSMDFDSLTIQQN